MGTKKRELSQQRRLERERAAAIESAQRRRRSQMTILGLLIAAALVVAVILVFALRDSGSTAKSGGDVKDVATVNKSLKGLTQDGFELGDPDAPVTIVEFVDPQCPACRDFFLREEPAVLDKIVRPGKARLELKTYAILGPDSKKAAAAMHAIAEQNRLFNFTAIFYHNQGQENSGYVTDKFIDLIARAAGVDVKQMHADLKANGSDYDTAVLDVSGEAQNLGLTGTPSFGIRINGGDIEAISAPQGVTADLLVDEVAKATKKAKAGA